ncbi:MAG: hypothetical protein ACKKMW_00215 [Candidatus Nealsonbacteria bacterium]
MKSIIKINFLNSTIKILGILILIVIIGMTIFLLFINGFFTPLIEKVINEKPEAKIIAYLEAVKKGDKLKALTIWELPNWEEWKLNENGSFLEKRRENLTKNLVENGIKNFKILKIEWWRTCCVPGVTNNPRSAGGARISIQLIDNNNTEYIYIFDVFHRETSYWGATEGYPVRHWVLRDIYLLGQKPLFWEFNHED